MFSCDVCVCDRKRPNEGRVDGSPVRKMARPAVGGLYSTGERKTHQESSSGDQSSTLVPAVTQPVELTIAQAVSQQIAMHQLVSRMTTEQAIGSGARILAHPSIRSV
jgi:hypothetical protein